MPDTPDASLDDLVRSLRRELAGVRKAEAAVDEVLEELRASRERMEKLLADLDDRDRVRSLVRRELWAAGGSGVARADPPRSGAPRAAPTPSDAQRRARPGESGDDRPPEADEERRDAGGWARSMWVGAAVVVVAAVVAVAAWLVFNQAQGEPTTMQVAGDVPPPARVETPAAKEPEASFFSRLPEEPRLRAQVYDSLWRVHSPLFDPLLGQVEEATSDESVEEALDAWRAGAMTPLQEDALHSALVQLALRREAGDSLAVDGTVLRNPCRGASCRALLDFWEGGGGDLRLPTVPDDAARESEALHTVEAVLVLGLMERA